MLAERLVGTYRSTGSGGETMVVVVGIRDFLLVKVQRLKKSRCKLLSWLHFDAANLLEI